MTPYDRRSQIRHVHNVNTVVFTCTLNMPCLQFMYTAGPERSKYSSRMSNRSICCIAFPTRCSLSSISWNVLRCSGAFAWQGTNLMLKCSIARQSSVVSMECIGLCVFYLNPNCKFFNPDIIGSYERIIPRLVQSEACVVDQSVAKSNTRWALHPI